MARRKEKAESAAPEGVDTPGYWKEQIDLVDRDYGPWRRRGDQIIKRYRDERTSADESLKRFNVLWSNVQTLIPSVYGRQPTPVVERRFHDKDVVGRVASQILERAMRYEMEDSEFGDSVHDSVLDYLLPGWGNVWVRYDPVIGQAESIEETGDEEETDALDNEPDAENAQVNTDAAAQQEEVGAEPAEQVLSENIRIDYVNWKDFYPFPPKVRKWKEVEAVGKRVYMSREELIERFGEEVGKEVPLDHTPDGLSEGRKAVGGNAKATVFEIWHKPSRKVYFVAKDYDKFLEDPKDDPLHLEGFWPCPKPLMATTTNEQLIPVADYHEYQDQAIQLDELTKRIDSLMRALKVAGCYDASAKGLSRLLEEGGDNKLIPVEAWAAFAQKGGLASAIAFLPIKEVSEVLLALFEARDKIKADLYEITGIADILRGESDPSETAKAQQIKGHFATVRLQDRRSEVARYCRDIVRIMGEIMAEHFSPETLIMASGVMQDEGIGPKMPEPPKPPDQSAMSPQGPQQPPQMAPRGPPQGQPVDPQQAMMAQQQAMQAQMAAQQAYQAAVVKYQIDYAQAQAEKMQLINSALELLRSEKLRGFRIDIETDTTVAEDAAEGKSGATEFVSAVTGFLDKAAIIAQTVPSTAPLLGKMLQFAVRQYRTGRDLESAIDEFVTKAEQDAKAAAEHAKANPQQHPEAIKQQSEQMKAQAEIAKAQIDAQSEQQNALAEQQKALIEQRTKELELQMKQQAHAAALELKEREHMQKLAMMDREHQQKLQLADITAQHKMQEKTQAAVEIKPNMAELSGPISEAMSGLATIMAQHHQQQAQLLAQHLDQQSRFTAQHHAAMLDVLNKPKPGLRVVRDAKGRVSHTEPMTH